MKRQIGGRPKLPAHPNQRHCVTLVIEGRFGTAFATAKQLRLEISKLLSDINVRCVLEEVGLGAQVQQRKPFQSCKHVLNA